LSSAKHSKRFLDAVLANVIDGIVTIDAHGVIQTFNPAAESIFVYASSEVMGRRTAGKLAVRE